MRQSVKVRSTSSPAPSSSSGSAASDSNTSPSGSTTGCGTGATGSHMKFISTGGGPPWRYSSQKDWFGASTNSHGLNKVQMRAGKLGTGGLTGSFRRRFLTQLREDIWPPSAWGVGHDLTQKGHWYPSRGGGGRHGFGAPPEAISCAKGFWGRMGMASSLSLSFQG